MFLYHLMHLTIQDEKTSLCKIQVCATPPAICSGLLADSRCVVLAAPHAGMNLFLYEKVGRRAIVSAGSISEAGPPPPKKFTGIQGDLDPRCAASGASQSARQRLAALPLSSPPKLQERMDSQGSIPPWLRKPAAVPPKGGDGRRMFIFLPAPSAAVRPGRGTGRRTACRTWGRSYSQRRSRIPPGPAPRICGGQCSQTGNSPGAG